MGRVLVKMSCWERKFSFGLRDGERIYGREEIWELGEYETYRAKVFQGCEF
jgi:hypothetical protein